MKQSDKEQHYKNLITEVQDFPTPGINFKDISPLLASTNMFRLALYDMLQGHNNDLWAGIESRGFLIASGLSGLNGGGILMIRKSGKLPPPIIEQRYHLEYGVDTLQVKPNCTRVCENEEHKKSVVLVDDVLATGGTITAAYNLLVKGGYDVLGVAVLIDLLHLHSDDFNVGGHKVHSVIQYKDVI